MKTGFFTGGGFGLTVDECGGACRLSKRCQKPKVRVTGPAHAKLLIVDESPNAFYDKVGKVGGSQITLLEHALNRAGVSLKDCQFTHAVRCFPPKGRRPTSNEVNACRMSLWQTVEANKPRAVLLLGPSSLEAWLGLRWKHSFGSINRWRGWTIPDWEKKAWVIPTYSLLHTHKEKDNIVFQKQFIQDVAVAVRASRRTAAPPPLELNVTSMLTKPDILMFLRRLPSLTDLIAFDYETTGLKPHRKGHKIVCCAVAWMGRDDKAQARAFMMDDEEVRAAWRAVLLNKHIRKVAANIKFEEAWSRVRLLVKRVVRWVGDTMTNAHILDCRSDITSLKFQAAVRFGVFDYDSEVSPFLKAIKSEEKKHGANAFNNIHRANPMKLLRYNGIDALIELLLYFKQVKDLARNFQ